MYKFKKSDAADFAKHVHATVRQHGDQLQFKLCPYCKGGKNHDTWTFAIALNEELGPFNCKRSSCGMTGNMITLHKDFNFSLGSEADEYYTPTKIYKKIPVEKVEVRDPAIAYMKSRGISEEVTRRYEITTQKDAPNILVFPFRDEKGDMWFAKYRKMDFDKTRDKNKEWSEKGRKPILFGMNHVPAGSKTLIITEGQIDSLSCVEAGYPNTVSVPTGALGFTWFPACFNWIQKFEELIVFGDYENGHITLLNEMSSRFQKTVKHVQIEHYRDCKDANDLLRRYGKEAIRKAIENAVSDPVLNIMPLADVMPENEIDMPRFPSSFPAVDMATGGLQLGQLVVITGQTGLGKSTFGEQLITFSVKAGFTSLIYSGELRNYKVQQAIDRQIAGPDYIARKPNASIPGYSEPIVYKAQADKIHDWYRNSLYLYDISGQYRKDAKEKEDVSLIKTIEKAIIQNNVQVILIDNVMTAIDDNSDIDQYRQQTIFTKELKSLVMTYGVLIILIAHPRKGKAEKIDVDEIAGSSNIPNLADLVLVFTNLTKEEEVTYKGNNCNRKISIIKNRATGRTVDAIPVYYEPDSGRVIEMPKRGDTYDPSIKGDFRGKQFDYGWLPDDEFVSADSVPDTIPF